MDKLKKILKPGHKDEEHAAAPSNTTAESQQKEHNILRQVVNPGGAKYDSQAFGTTTTWQEPAPLATVPADAVLQTDPEEKKHEHTVLRQILNPGGDKYDAERFGTTAHVVTGDAAAQVLAEARPTEQKHEHGVLRQIVNPGGEKYDSTAFGAPVAGAAATTSTTATSAVPASETTTATAVPQTVKPTYVSNADDATYTYSSTPVGVGASMVQATPSAIDNLHAAPAGESAADEVPSTGVRHGQAIHEVEGGAAAAGAGLLAGSAVASQVNQPRTDDEIAAATHVDRSYPLAGSDAQPSEGTDAPVESLASNTSTSVPAAAVVGGAAAGATGGAALASTSGHTDAPITTTTNTLASPAAAAHTQPVVNAPGAATSGIARDDHAGEAAATAGVAGAGAAAVYSSDIPHQSDKHERKLQEARAEEAALGGDRGEEKKKRNSLIYKITHLGHKGKHHETDDDHAAVPDTTEAAARSAAQTALAEHGHGATVSSLDPAMDKAGVVIEPHTGLPMNPAKYGTTGAGGTDGSQQIKGFQGHDDAEIAAQQAYNPTVGLAGPLDKDGPAAAGPNWEAIKKANTLY